MRRVYAVADSIVSPLGNSSEENYHNVCHNITGITKVESSLLGDLNFYASMIKGLNESIELSRFETIAINAVKGALRDQSPDLERTLMILSTTKGNIEYLKSHHNHPRISLHATANHIAAELGFKNSLVVSNACISGVLALIIAKRFLISGKFDHAIVVGAEVLSPFIISGFQSLRALSDGPCKPFDKTRSGISLGEAAGAMLLTGKPEVFDMKSAVEITGEGISNDANHISGPSRTGKELAIAINSALKSANIDAEQIDSISAHGTATIFNDEMEAKAFTHARMEYIPINSLKGYFGHTLGAAGVVETIISKHALLRNEVIGTKGFDSLGVSLPVNINRSLVSKPQRRILKTASGFGGCNAALVLERIEV
jgi:3-oxoacyl-[acyl-carrier-protein] synthase-1